LQLELERTGIVSAMAMGARTRWLSATVLILAGAYQLSPLKRACLSHCRAPAAFLSHHWRPDPWNALRLGLRHGAYCVGCCWLLMAMLFVGGVMNLAWIAALSLLVLAEKVLPMGRWVGTIAGVMLVAWGMATLIV
jgi:predicted metal-binding membrane protein